MELKKSEDVQEHLFAFFNLLVTILKRRSLFRMFEENLKDKDTQKNVTENSFVSYYITDYTRGQLIDLRKFFVVDKSSYRIIDLVNYIVSSELQTKYEELKKIWEQEFKKQVDKQIAHIDRNTEDLSKKVGKINVDNFIDRVDGFALAVIGKLKEKGRLVIQEELRDPEGHFLRSEQADEFNKYLGWASKK